MGLVHSPSMVIVRRTAEEGLSVIGLSQGLQNAARYLEIVGGWPIRASFIQSQVIGLLL